MYNAAMLGWLLHRGWDGKRGSPVPGTGKHWSQGKRRCHGERAEMMARAGREWWSRRASIAGVAGWSIGSPGAKTMTHRVERRIAKREMREWLDSLAG